MDALPEADRRHRLAGEVRADATPRGTRVRWDAAHRPMALVRDADPGRILSFARGGEVTVPGRRSEVVVDLSHGTGSHRTRLPVEQRR